jgi:serine/threonine protein kinase
MVPTARRRLGKYVLLGRLGAGGMGKIYLARTAGPAGIEKLLVVKRLHSHLTNDPVLVASFLDEARLSLALNHPNIVHTFDVGDVDGRYFMVMEYIDGQNLGVVLRMAKRSGEYPPSSLWAGLFIGVLDGLHAAHTANDARGRPLQIIHRDVSPQNMLLTYEGLPKLVDFGIAKAAMRVNETDAGTLKGKYAYMSPEQVRGEVLDARSDVFAAGIVLWEMLAGRRLYKADTIVRTVERILTEPPSSPVRVNPACDPRLAAVVEKALQKNRDDRYASAAEFRDALEEALHASGVRYRVADGKALMTRLFADVITRQRAVLETALADNDDNAAIAADDDDGPRSPSDSQSDLRMPRLGMTLSGAAESTTPSAARRLPLVTAEGEPPAPGAPARVLAPPADKARSKTPATASALPRRPSSPSSGPSSSAPSPAAPTSLAPSPAAVLAPPLETSVVAARPAGPRWPWLVAAGAVLLVVVVGLWAAMHADDVAHADAGPALVVDAGALVVDAGIVDDAAGLPPGTVELAAADAGSALADAGVLADDDDAADVEATKPVDAGVRVVKPRPPPPQQPPPPVEVVEEQGFLTLDTVPWTTVYLGKKKLGETPLVKVPVPAGALELTLVNSEAGVREAYIARIKPGETFKTRLELQ